MWFALLGMKMFFHVGEEMKVWSCQIWAVGRVLKNFPAPSFQKIDCRMSCMWSALSCNNSALLPDIWGLLHWTALLSFLRVAWWAAELTVSLGGEKCNRSTPCMSQNTVAISFPELVDVLNFLMVGDPGCFHAIECTFVSEQYWCTEVSSPVMICSKKSSPWSLKWRRWVRDASIRFFLWFSVSCRGTHPKRSWTMSQIVPCERLNCSSNSLSDTQRLACTVSSIAGKRSADVEGCPAPLFICHTHATATKLPTPFLHVLHGHHIWAINCLNFMMNFNWSCPFCPQNPNNWSNLFLCPHTKYNSHCGTASSTNIAELELWKCFHLVTNVWTWVNKEASHYMKSFGGNKIGNLIFWLSFVHISEISQLLCWSH